MIFMKTNFELKYEPGFSIVEIVVTIFAFTVLAWGVLMLFSGIFTSSSQQGTLLAGADSARKLSFQFSQELRGAAVASNGAYVLEKADEQEIIFYSPNADADTGVERIRYFVNGDELFKGVVEYNGSDYDDSTEKSYSVQKNLANGSRPVFYYYDGDYVGSSTQIALLQPVSVTQVKYVKLNLEIFNKAGVENDNYYNVSTGVAVRNIKTNLGD